jgi:subtilase family serine protease
VTLDLQWAPATAPHATIYVVEAPSDSPIDLFAAVAVASHAWPRTGAAQCR